MDKGPALARSAGASGIAAVDMFGDRVSIRFAPPFGIASTGTASPGPAGELDPQQGVEVIGERELDALDDPSTYPDGHVPGYEIDPAIAEETP